jgi:hypothetical protein
LIWNATATYCMKRVMPIVSRASQTRKRADWVAHQIFVFYPICCTIHCRTPPPPPQKYIVFQNSTLPRKSIYFTATAPLFTGTFPRFIRAIVSASCTQPNKCCCRPDLAASHPKNHKKNHNPVGKKCVHRSTLNPSSKSVIKYTT